MSKINWHYIKNWCIKDTGETEGNTKPLTQPHLTTLSGLVVAELWNEVTHRDRTWTQIFQLSIWCFNCCIIPTADHSLPIYGHKMPHHNLSYLYIANVALLKSHMTGPTQAACLAGHPFPLQQHSSTPHSVTHSLSWWQLQQWLIWKGGKYLFLASCNGIQQLGSRSWKYHMRIRSQQNSGLHLRYRNQE